MTSFPCPKLGEEVELTAEREGHIRERHPDLLPDHREKIGEALADPDVTTQRPHGDGPPILEVVQ